MYGMIHKAAREMARERYGEAEWRAILADSGLAPEHFIDAKRCGDATTGALLDALVRRSGMARDELLEAFGRYWVGFVAASPYGSVMDMAGDDLTTFLDNLDRLHASVRTSLPGARSPSFDLVHVSEERLVLAYRSERAGFAPFARGVLLGLMAKFGEAGRIHSRAGEGRVLFEIDRRAADAA